LVLRWRHINFTDQYLHITEAWKGRDEIGDTKSGRSRIVPLSSRIIEKFDNLRLESLYLQPDDFLFCYDDGSQVGETWWHGRFKRALRRAQIEVGDRWLTPHSFPAYFGQLNEAHQTSKTNINAPHFLYQNFYAQLTYLLSGRFASG